MNTALTKIVFPNPIGILLENLEEKISAILQQNNNECSFEKREKELHRTFIDAERKVVETLLCQYDIDMQTINFNNKIYRRVIRGHKTYMSASGAIRIERSLYRTKGAAETICPLEFSAGIIESQWTPCAAKQALYVVSQLTPYEAEGVFSILGNMNPSKSSLDRLPKKLGRKWNEQRDEFELLLREQSEVPSDAVTIAVSLDGVLIPMQGGRVIPGDSRYEEASCGTITYYNKIGEALLTRRHGCMPEHKKKTMKSFLKEEVEYALQQRPLLQLVKVADGAKDNWSFLDGDLPQGLSVLDFYHAAEHLKKAFDLAYPKDDIKASAEFSKYRSLLRHDVKGVNKVIRHLSYLANKYPKKKLLLTELNYFKNNKKRCCYKSIADNNLPIGSGIIEATCKTLVTQRLKRSGMCWGMDGGQSIMTFRSLLQSQLFDEAWEMLRKKYKTEMTLPNNVVMLRRNRE